MTDLLTRLKRVVLSGDGWTAHCPAHDDRHLSIHQRDARWLLKCHAGCAWQAIIDALGMDAAELFDDEERGVGRVHPSDNRATAQPTNGSCGRAGAPRLPEDSEPTHRGPGLTLDQYATAKGLPMDFLNTSGLSEFTFDHEPAIRIPYLGERGAERAVRFRIALDGDRFRWKIGTKPCLYGLDRLSDVKQAKQVVLVEGESDCPMVPLDPRVGHPWCRQLA